MNTFTIMQILVLIVGLAAGFLIAYFYFRLKSAQGLDEIVRSHPVAMELRATLDKLASDLHTEREQKIAALNAQATSEANLKALGEKLLDQDKGIQKVREDFSKEFENLANR